MDNIPWYMLALCVGAATALLIAVPILKRKGILNNKNLRLAREGINSMSEIGKLLKVTFPKNSAISIADKILSYASIGVANAEQLYRTDVIDSDERKDEAMKFVRESLLLSGINSNKEILSVADGCIEAAVHALGHSVNADKEEKAIE